MSFLRSAFFTTGALAALGLLAASCSNNSPAIAKVYLNAQVIGGSHPSNVCGVAGSQTQWVTIGTPTASVQDGDTQNGGAVSVGCTVHINGDGTFNVNGTGSVTGTAGGSVTVVSAAFMPPPAMVMGVRAVFQRGDNTGKFASSDCTVDYTMNANMGIGSGKVWGRLTCPDLIDTDSTAFVDGGAVPRECSGTAEFRFENCAE